MSRGRSPRVNLTVPGGLWAAACRGEPGSASRYADPCDPNANANADTSPAYAAPSDPHASTNAVNPLGYDDPSRARGENGDGYRGGCVDTGGRHRRAGG